MSKSDLAFRNIAVRTLVVVTLLCSMSFAQASSTVGLTVGHAQRAARESGRIGFALLVLPQGTASALSLRTEALVARDSAVRFAMQSYDLVELKPDAHGVYRLSAPRASCEGISACAEDAFLDGSFSVRQLRSLNAGVGKVPLVLVFDTSHAHPVAIAYGLSTLDEALGFAAALHTGNSQQPLIVYGDELLDD